MQARRALKQNAFGSVIVLRCSIFVEEGICESWKKICRCGRCGRRQEGGKERLDSGGAYKGGSRALFAFLKRVDQPSSSIPPQRTL